MINRHFLMAAPVLFALFVGWPDALLLAAPHQQLSLRARIHKSYLDIVQSHAALSEIMSFMNSRPDLFSKAHPERQRLLSRDQRMTIWQTWQRFLDHMIALDLLGQQYEALERKGIEGLENALFYGRYAVFLTQYRYALEFIRIAERDSILHTVLNDPVPEIGLPGGTYSNLKSDFLNVAKAAQFAQMDLKYRISDPGPPEAIAHSIEEDSEYIWDAGKGAGPLATLKNALTIARDAGHKTWLPVQKQVAEWMGDTKLWRTHQSLISGDQIEGMHPLLEPGDIFLTRREWYLSNIGMPGFWPHSALYVGTPEERKKYFDKDPGVTVWTKMHGIKSGDFEALLQKKYPDAYKENQVQDPGAGTPKIVEATGDGVSLVSLKTTASADSLAVLRPRLPKLAKARAVLRAFHYKGRPYDFDFDFRTDSKLVCTELIYKAYEPEPHIAGLMLPLQEILGREIMTANDLVRLFDKEYEMETRQLDLVVFLDGDETDKKAYLNTPQAFRKSWKRPKWHILVADDALSQE